MGQEIRETTFPARTYLVWRKQVEIAKITDSAMWGEAFGKVFQEAQKGGMKIAGPAAALYFSWNEESGVTELGIGIPVEEAAEVSDPDLSLASIEESDASAITVIGSYDGLRSAHEAMWGYISEKGLQPGLTVEEYEVTEHEAPNVEDWRTNVYYLHK